jgi:hypothetical protein
VFWFWKMVYGNFFRKPFSVFSFGILRSNTNIFSLTFVLHCNKRLQMLKTFYGKRFQPKQTEPKIVSTPLEMNACLTLLDGTPLSDTTLYCQLVGSLVYLTVTHPDIAHAVHLVSQFLSAPHSTHYAAMIHILRYIKGTIFTDFTSLLIPPLTSVLILMLIGLGILLTAALLLDFVSFWETLLFLGAIRNNILCLALALRQTTVLWLILLLNFLLFTGCWKIWVLHILH